MRYKAEEYAHAFLETKGDAHEIKNFITLIRKNGDWTKRGAIVTAIEKISARNAGGKNIVAEFAREGQLPDFFKKITAPNILEIKIKPELIAGMRVTIDGEREADFTFKRKLQKLFS